MDPCGGKGLSGTARVRKLGVRPSIGWLSAALLACGGCSPAARDSSVQIDALMRFRNVIVRSPAHHLSVVVLTNCDEPEPYFLALAIAKVYLPTADAVHAARSATGPDSG
jgi:hypothetical protein